MRLSFVIPAYNEEAYIGKCLDSIFRELRDGNHEVEIIVVNNASTDRTKEIASKYKGVKVVDEPRKGLVRARQAGFLASTGDLIANVDADAMLTQGWIKTVFAEFSKNPKLVALSGPFVYYDLPKWINFFVKTLHYPISFLAYLVGRFILRKSAVLQGGNFVVRRDALEKIGGYNTNIEFYGEDTDIAVRMSKVGAVKFTYSLPMYASGRRIAEEGVFTMGIRYGANYLSMAIFKKPLSKTSSDIRLFGESNVLEYEPQRRLSEFLIATTTLAILSGIIFGVLFGAYKLFGLLISLLTQ